MRAAMKVLGTAAVAVALVGTSTAHAGLLDDCGAYAQSSAKQEQENQLTCKVKLKGPFWTTDLAKHTAFCKASPPQKWKAALEKRKAALKACK
ncbi:MAG: hypothetical protein AAFZ01_02820 [Pseudomonadota bacterium]